jgi:conjugative transfer signal peptidase TraF
MHQGKSHSSHRPRRKLPAALSVSCMAVIATLAAGEATGLRINTTASMPRGLWRVQNGAKIGRGEIVTICPPDCADVHEGARRGYISTGNCPGGYEPLVKPIAAIPGDLVTVSPEGILVNGQPLPNTKQLIEDETGRPLHPVPAGSYRVTAGEVWLLSGHDPRSFDGRYFGAVPVANLIGIARPLWVLP